MQKTGWRAAASQPYIRLPAPSPTPDMTIITDPLFYMLAIPAIVALGIGKGGFAGAGMASM